MSESNYFEVHRGSITTIRFVEPELFDTLLVEELRNDLIQFTESETPEKLLLDFSVVVFCSTALINTLLRMKKIVEREGSGQFKLCEMQPNVRSALQSLNLDGSVFKIYATASEAQADFGD